MRHRGDDRDTKSSVYVIKTKCEDAASVVRVRLRYDAAAAAAEMKGISAYDWRLTIHYQRISVENRS